MGFIDNLESQIGGAASGIIGQGLGLVFNDANADAQANTQSKLNAVNLQYNKDVMDYSYGKQLQMWQDTNYPAQVEQLTKAGLNPALLYGSHGGGGVTTGTPTTGGAQATAPGTKPMEIAALMLENQATQAEINLKNAQAENIKAQTPQVSGLMEAQTNSLTQGVQNQKAQEALTNMQTTAQSIQNNISGQTQDETIAQIRAATTSIETQAQQAVRNNYIDQSTMDTKIKMIQGEMIGIYLRNELTKAQTGLTEEQITQTVNTIQQNWQNVNINKQNANTNQGHLELDKLIKDTPASKSILYQGLTRLIPNIVLGF